MHCISLVDKDVLREKGTPCLSRPKEPLIFSPAVAPLLQDSWHSLHNPTFLSLASPTSDVGCVENACCFGRVSKFRGDHESVRRRTCDRYDNRNGCTLSQYLWAQSQNTDQHHWYLTFSSFSKFFWTPFFAGAHRCHSHRRLCRWCHPIEEQHGSASALPAPTSSERHLNLWSANVGEKKDFVKKRKHHEFEKETMLNSKHYAEWKKIYDDDIDHYLTFSICYQKSAPAPQHKSKSKG